MPEWWHIIQFTCLMLFVLSLMDSILYILVTIYFSPSGTLPIFWLEYKLL
jgi:hypothetical protein